MVDQPKLLILGGTDEARQQADVLANHGYEVVYSLAGVTTAPVLPKHPNIDLVSGGFGGLAGLEAFIETNRIDCLIDATHAFASAMSETVGRVSNIPTVRLIREPWAKVDGDRWQEVTDLDAAIDALPPKLNGQVFLALGAKHIGKFSNLAHLSFVARMIEAPDNLPQHIKLIQQRGPFSLEAEIELLCENKITLMLVRNSGAVSSYAKIQAARDLGVPVIMIQPPQVGPNQANLITASQLVSHLSQLFV